MNNSSRREFLRKSAMLAAAAGLYPLASKAENLILAPQNNFQLPPLPYAYDALEPWIDKETMRIHHDFHHNAYVANLNIGFTESYIDVPLKLEDLFKYISAVSPKIRNNAGGHWNHTMFWDIMKPGGKKEPEGALLEAINSQFNSFAEFKRRFAEIALGRFGSGWAWLVVTENKRLNLFSLPNQDNPLMDVAEQKGTPVLCLDVWEHAYYLKYQYKRYEYIDAWWNVVNWDEVSKRYHEAMKS
jgi:Fe-Mn family superoxide dismutase